jgi:DNA-binding CsgD family transcriptional regulator
MTHIGNERLSEIIGAIYDCVLAPENWAAVLVDIMAECNFGNAVLTVHNLTSTDMRSVIAVGIDEEWLAAAGPDYSQDIAALWGGPTFVPNVPLEEPVVQSDATPRSTWVNNRYFQQFVKPRGFHDAVAIGLVRDSKTFAVLAFGREERKGNVAESEKEALRLIAPHLRRAVVIGRLLEQQTATAASFTDVVERIAPGVVMVDEAMGIVYANRAGHRLLEQGEVIEARQEKLYLRNEVANKVLAGAVARAASSEKDIEHRSIDIPVRTLDGLPTVVQVLPMQRRQFAHGVAQRATAAIFISNAADPPRLPSDALALMYDLTPAEARIFEMIVAGKTPAAIASELKVALPTVKTHLSRVFDKTSCNRQADLVAIAAKAMRTFIDP